MNPITTVPARPTRITVIFNHKASIPKITESKIMVHMRTMDFIFARKVRPLVRCHSVI